jgi:hypothetical protein
MTLTTDYYNKKLREIINHAEELFGQADKKITINPILFADSTVTQIVAENEIQIVLPKYCLNDEVQGIYQLSHEAVHCLGHPGRFSPVTMLEEGIATFFQTKYYNPQAFLVPEDRYGIAYRLFDEMYSINKDLIRKIRSTKPTISYITADDILNVDLNVPVKLAAEITEPFYRAT